MTPISYLNTFTKILSFSFILVFIYLFIPSHYLILEQILKYGIIISIIIALMFYKQVIEKVSLNTNDYNIKTMESSKSYNSYYKLKNSDLTKTLFKNLKEIAISMADNINLKSKSALYIFDPKARMFFLQAGNKTDFKESISMDNKKVVEYIFNSKKIHQKDNLELWINLFPDNSWRGSECAIFSPVKLHGSDLGFILTYFNHFKNLRDEDIKIFKKLGEFITFNIENLDSLEHWRSQELSKNLILDILSNLNVKSDEQNIFNQFKYFFRTSFQYDRLTISLRKETKNRRKIDKSINSIIKLTDGIKDDFVEGSEFPNNGTLHGLPIISGESIVSEDWNVLLPNLSRFNSQESGTTNYKIILGSPIIIGGEAKGSIMLEKNEGPPFTENDIKNLETVGKTLGTSLEWLIEYNKIYDNATHDGLSGLLNHQTFKERFNDEIQRAERFQHKMSVMIFDLDKFKNINDTLGHQYGDYIIQTCSKIMKDNVRAVDVVARYGGEEFAIILINTDDVMSNIVAQRIVDTIANYPFKIDNVEAKMTISGGMSQYPSDSKNMKELIEYADQAMYSSKQVGGNKFSIHSKAENVNV